MANKSPVVIIPLIAVMTVLTLVPISVFRTRLPPIFSRTNHTTEEARRPSRHELPEEKAPLLSCIEVQDALPRQIGQPQSTGDTSTRLTAEIETAREAIAKLEQDLSTSVFQNAELQRRYETLSRELEGARLFLNTADIFADSEVIQTLTKLNVELRDISTSIAEHVFSVFKLDSATSDPDQKLLVDRASESIGSTLVQFLWTAKRDDPNFQLYLQIAFQAYLSYQIFSIVSSWTLDKKHSAFLNEMYQRLQAAEKQAISARWRFLTHRHSLLTCASDPASFVALVIEGLSILLLAVGCATPQPNVISELSSMFEENILIAVSLAGRLNQMINGVFSGDFEVYVVQPGEAFQGGMMEEESDGSGDGTQGMSGGATQSVLCTSELGLTKRVQLETGEKETKMVIKAKVLLESFLDAED